MWEEITLKSPLSKKRKFITILCNEQDPNVCREPDGEEATRLKHLDHFFRHKTKYQAFIYDDGTLDAVLSMKWSHYQDCYRLMAVMSSTVGDINKLKSLVKIFADKFKSIMEEKKIYKFCINPIWGNENKKHRILKPDGSVSIRDVPYAARMYRNFWTILEEGLKKEDIKFVDNKKENMWFLYWQR